LQLASSSLTLGQQLNAKGVGQTEALDMERIFRDFDDEPLEKLRLHCRVFGAVCAKATSDPRPGPFNAPYGAFIDVGGEVSGWISVNYREGLTYDELIEAVRLEAMSWAVTGRLAGAALMVCATGPNGQDGLIVQIETRKSRLTLLYQFDENGEIIDDPGEGPPLLPEGLCFFA
jgi:hypothetical protein